MLSKTRKQWRSARTAVGGRWKVGVPVIAVLAALAWWVDGALAA